MILGAKDCGAGRGDKTQPANIFVQALPCLALASGEYVSSLTGSVHAQPLPVAPNHPQTRMFSNPIEDCKKRAD